MLPHLTPAVRVSSVHNTHIFVLTSDVGVQGIMVRKGKYPLGMYCSNIPTTFHTTCIFHKLVCVVYFAVKKESNSVPNLLQIS